MINSSLNRKSLRKRFSHEGRIRIDNFLEKDVVDAVRDEVQQAPFELVYVVDGKVQQAGPAKMQSMSDSQRQSINNYIMSEAAKGSGFLYGSCHMGVGRPKEIGPNMVKLFEFIQSEEMLDFVRTLTRNDNLNDVSGHYTRYNPGHFLTRHRDVVDDEKRRFAYVMSFTSEWHPDWGGLLQYYEEDGTPKDAWAPRYNSLTVFDVKHIHAVTFVTPFAQAPRLSLTGWFNALPGK